MATGSTPAGSTNWIQFEYGPGIYVDIDASSAGFSGTPQYITSLGGNNDHWRTTGATSIYNATNAGFRVYVRNVDDANITPQYANQNGWHINWAAFGT
jgi:hypothetical protein